MWQAESLSYHAQDIISYEEPVIQSVQAVIRAVRGEGSLIIMPEESSSCCGVEETRLSSSLISHRIFKKRSSVQITLTFKLSPTCSNLPGFIFHPENQFLRIWTSDDVTFLEGNVSSCLFQFVPAELWRFDLKELLCEVIRLLLVSSTSRLVADQHVKC